jgi:ADP-ribosylglycohydrolase
MGEVGSGARSRALGALYGLAIGDALGMPTQSRSRADIVARYGSLLDGFEPGGCPRAPSPMTPSRRCCWPAW